MPRLDARTRAGEARAPYRGGVHPLDELHAASDDPWGVDRHHYEARKRALTVASLPRPRYGHALEVGCSIGALAQDLAGRCDDLLAVDLSSRAVATARERLAGIPRVAVEQRRIPEEWPDKRFDLVVVSEMGYFLTVDALAALRDRIDACLDDDGALVLCHWLHPIEGWHLQGIDVHHAFATDARFEVLATHREPDFALDVLQRPGAPSPARREGLV